MLQPIITVNDFEKIDIRVGRIIEVKEFPEARKPAYILMIDLGPELGIKKSSAQLKTNYSSAELLNKLVLCVVNFAPRQIGPVKSEVLTLGIPDDTGNTIIVTTQRSVPLGGKLY